jgi:hypothetical protein
MVLVAIVPQLLRRWHIPAVIAIMLTGIVIGPIIPGAENASYIELRETGLKRVLNGTFAGEYQDGLIARFNAALSPVPPWQTGRSGKGL